MFHNLWIIRQKLTIASENIGAAAAAAGGAAAAGVAASVGVVAVLSVGGVGVVVVAGESLERRILHL